MRKTGLVAATLSTAVLAPAALAPDFAASTEPVPGVGVAASISPEDQAAINRVAPAEVARFIGSIAQRIPSFKKHPTSDYFKTTQSGMKISLQPDFIPTNMRLDIEKHKGTYGKSAHFSSELLEVTYSKASPKKIEKLILDLKHVAFRTSKGRVLKDANGEFLVRDEDFTRYDFELDNSNDWRVGVFTPFQKDLGFWAGTAKVVKDVAKDIKPHLDHILR